MVGLVPAISLMKVPCSPDRDHWDSRFARPSDDSRVV